MTGTAQEDVRLVMPCLLHRHGRPESECPLCAFDRLTTLLTSYESLGSVKYLVALQVEHEAEKPAIEWGEFGDDEWYAWCVAHGNAERLRDG